MKIISSMHDDGEGRGSIRAEDVFDTDVDDLWRACTTPDRLARWIADVSGDLQVGGRFEARFTSGWEGTGRIERCEPPHRLVVLTTESGAEGEDLLEATLTAEGDKTRLVIEEHGLPADALPGYAAGWHVHLEDLAAHLGDRSRSEMATRWRDVLGLYADTPVG